MGLAPDTPLRLSGELEAQPDTGFVKAIDEMLAEARREHPAGGCGYKHGRCHIPMKHRRTIW